MSFVKPRADELLRSPTFRLRDTAFAPKDALGDAALLALFGAGGGALAGYLKYTRQHGLTTARAPFIFTPHGMTAKHLFDASVALAQFLFTAAIAAGLYGLTRAASANLREKEDAVNDFYAGLPAFAFALGVSGRPAHVALGGALAFLTLGSVVLFLGWVGEDPVTLKTGLASVKDYEGDSMGRWQVVQRKPLSALKEYLGEDHIVFRGY